MTILQGILEFLKSLVVWWVICEPWEQAVRVRFGKQVKLLHAGVHLRIPFFDKIYVQNVRRRVLSLSAQTMTTRDGIVITLNGSIGYKIDDVLKLHQTLHDAEGSILQEILGLVTKHVAHKDASECTAVKIAEEVNNALDLTRYGISATEFFLSTYIANVRSLRLISDSPGGYCMGSNLSTIYGDAQQPSPGPR